MVTAIYCYIADLKILLPRIDVVDIVDTNHLKQIIRAKAAPRLDWIASSELVLYKVKRSIPLSQHTEELDTIVAGLFPSGKALQSDLELLRWARMSTLFPGSPPESQLHFVVCLPEGKDDTFNKMFNRPIKRKLNELKDIIKTKRTFYLKSDARARYNNVTSEILSHWLPDIRALPETKHLSQFLNEPFDERAKIPLDRYRFEAFISSPLQNMRDGIRREDVERLFRIDDHERAEGLYGLFYAAIMKSPPGCDATESAFHSFWDVNIRDIMEALIPGGKSIRDCNFHTSAAAQRPDFGFLHHNICPFRGEERSPSSAGEPRDKLRDKMVWIYDPAPYVLGYYATGSMVTLTAICPPERGSSIPEIVDILKVDLGLTSNRIRNLVRLIKLCSLIVPITTVIGPRICTEFLPIRGLGKTIEVCGTNIKKIYDGPQRHERLQKLQKIYAVLEEKEVPNVDHIKLSYSDDKNGSVAFLEPKGISVMPKTIRQVLEAVGCILDALIIMHREPPIFHRDIRWPNVVQCADDRTKWFLIDWDDAATPPTLAAKHLDSRNHSPAIFEDNHGAEVDLWAVGRLIIERSRHLSGFPSDLLKVGKDMQSGILNVSQSSQKIRDIKKLL